jgi:hypothetical protein
LFFAFVIFFILFFSIVLLFLVVKFLKKAIFLGDESIFSDAESVYFNEECKVKENIFVLGKVKKSRGSKIQEFDLTIQTDQEQIGNGFVPKGDCIKIYNFDYMMYDCELNLQKLEFLEKLVFYSDLKVMVFSQFEPLGYFYLKRPKAENQPNSNPDKKKISQKINIDPQDQDIYKRWERVLGYFRFQYSVSQRLIENSGDVSQDIFNEIWRSCSREEKLVLVQLALEGFLNYKNKKVIENLFKRKLIKLSPLRLVTKNLNHYINTVEDLNLILDWEKRKLSRSWKNIRRQVLLLLSGAVLFLIITQPQVLRAWMILVPAITGGIPTILKLFDQFSSESPHN